MDYLPAWGSGGWQQSFGSLVPSSAGDVATAGNGAPQSVLRLLLNKWPKLLTNMTKGLPSTAGLPATIEGAGLPSTLEGAAARVGAGSLAGPLGMGAAMAMQPTPANQGETPFYVIDPTTGRLVPNPAAAANTLGPNGGFGGGNTTTTPPPALSMGGGAFAGRPTPTPAAPVGSPMNILAYSSPSSTGPSGAPNTSGPSLIQKFMDMLAKSPTAQGATQGQLSGTPWGVTGSMFGGS